MREEDDHELLEDSLVDASCDTSESSFLITGKQIFEICRTMSQSFATNLPGIAESASVIREMLQSSLSTVQPIIDFVKDLRQHLADAAVVASNISKTYQVVAILGENQLVVCEHLEPSFVQEILHADCIDSYILNWYSKDNFSKVKFIIAAIERNPQIAPYSNLFVQIKASFNNGHYYLAITGLFAIIDGLLSLVSKKTTTSITTRLSVLLDMIDAGMETQIAIPELEYEVVSFTYSLGLALTTISENWNFGGPEPPLLNRHWIMHGRSTRDISQLDCIKMFNLIYAITLMDAYSEAIQMKGIEENK